MLPSTIPGKNFNDTRADAALGKTSRIRTKRRLIVAALTAASDLGSEGGVLAGLPFAMPTRALRKRYGATEPQQEPFLWRLDSQPWTQMATSESAGALRIQRQRCRALHTFAHVRATLKAPSEDARYPNTRLRVTERICIGNDSSSSRCSTTAESLRSQLKLGNSTTRRKTCAHSSTHSGGLRPKLSAKVYSVQTLESLRRNRFNLRDHVTRFRSCQC
jgi:hypothetical protein